LSQIQNVGDTDINKEHWPWKIWVASISWVNVFYFTWETSILKGKASQQWHTNKVK